MDEKTLSNAMKCPTRRACFGGVLLASCAALIPALSARSAPESALSIWVSRQLGLGADVSDPVAAARRAMEEPFEDTPSMTVRVGSERVTKQVHNCRELLADASNIVGAPSDEEYRVLGFTAARCRALSFLSEASPAQESFVGDFRLDEKNLRYLPPRLALSVSPDELERERKVEREHGNILDFDPDLNLVPTERKPDTAQLEAPSWRATLTVYARADFTHKGLGEILLRRDGATRGGTYALSSIFVLGRTKPDSLLSIVWPPPPR